MVAGEKASMLGSLRTLFEVGSVGGMTDGQLLERFLARRGEAAEAAFAALVALHGPMVWSVCRGILADPHAAEDAFQATFLVLLRRAGAIRKKDAVGPWLHGVARRIAVRAKAVGARQRLVEAGGQGTDMIAAEPADPAQREQLEALHQEVDRLPARYRAAVVLCELEGRTHAQAAQLLSCPVGTVSTRVARARELLRSRLLRRGLTLAAVWAAGSLRPETAAAAVPTALVNSTIQAAAQVAASNALAAGVVPASVAQLALGELKTMLFTKLTMAGAGLAAAGLLTATLGWAALGGPPGANEPVAAAAAPAAAAALDDEQARAKSVNNLKQIALAFHNYASVNGSFPAQAIAKDGKPLLSWRVMILPFLEQQDLYSKFHLDEPWDSPHNKTLIEQIPNVYEPLAEKNEPNGTTYYQVFAGEGTLFPKLEGSKLAEITDGTSNTLLVVEAAKPVPWTKPADLPYDKEKPLPRLGQFENSFLAAFADGAVRSISKATNEETLRALITRSGGEVIDFNQVLP